MHCRLFSEANLFAELCRKTTQCRVLDYVLNPVGYGSVTRAATRKPLAENLRFGGS